MSGPEGLNAVTTRELPNYIDCTVHQLTGKLKISLAYKLERIIRPIERSSVHRGSANQSSLQSQPHLRPVPLLHYQTGLELPINGGESSLDGICSIGKQQVFQFQSNYSIKRSLSNKDTQNQTRFISKRSRS